MHSLTIGEMLSVNIATDRRHTADQFGNPGLYVVATPALIWLLEATAHRLLVPFLEQGEGTVGTVVDVAHLAPANEGTCVTAEVLVVEVDGRRIGFEVSARAGERILMKGKHVRTVVELDRFLSRLEPVRNRMEIQGRNGSQ